VSLALFWLLLPVAFMAACGGTAWFVRRS